MANLGQELASLDFANLIGGPLNAIVDAQAKSAIATANFVREVGFDKNGDVRNTRFRYTRQNADGNAQEFALDVPFLSMLPIPYVQIEEGEVEFNAKLSSQQETTNTTDLSGSASLDANISFWFVKAKVKASMSYKKTSSETEKVERTYDMRVRVKVKGTDLPTGTERILNMLENSLAESPTGYLSGPQLKLTTNFDPASESSGELKVTGNGKKIGVGDQVIFPAMTEGGQDVRVTITETSVADTVTTITVQPALTSKYDAGAVIQWRPKVKET